MPPEISPWEIYEVLLAFFFWLSVFVGLVSLVVVVLVGVSIYKLAKGAGAPPRSLLSAAFLAALFAHDAHGEGLQIPLGLDHYIPVPESNPLSPDKVSLGRRLFFDRRLSRYESLACAGCHDPAKAFTDGKAVSVGVFSRRGARNVPALINRGYGAAFFWDGRVPPWRSRSSNPSKTPMKWT